MQTGRMCRRWGASQITATAASRLTTRRLAPVGSPYTVTLSTDVTVEDLLLNSANATLSHTSGTLTATGAINLAAGTYSLAGGTIANSTVNATVPISLTSNAANTLSGVTVNGDLNFLPASTRRW